jgi:integrase
MTRELSTTGTAALERIGQAANDAAARSVFADYRTRKAANTLKMQANALSAFRGFLGRAGVHVDGLGTDPAAWRGVTWGLVEGFRNALVREGYAVGTVNAWLSTVKVYARLAAKAGALDRQELAMIASVDGYSRKDAQRVDDHRKAGGLPTRIGNKKATATPLSEGLVNALRERPDTPQGRRDAAILALALDLGLRVGELAALTVDNVEGAELHFYRSKVGKWQRHSLAVNGCLAVVRAYLENDAPSEGPLLRSSVKGGALGKPGMTTRAITARVRSIGAGLGIDLSAHDLRHSWATRAKQAGTQDTALTEAGGWASGAMVRRYGEAARIANEGVRLAY